jgi:hypothetical protein
MTTYAPLRLRPTARTMLRRFVVTTVLLLSFAAAEGTSVAAGVTLDFESFPDGTPTSLGDQITTQYASDGVVFDYHPPLVPLIERPPNSNQAHSGNFVLVGPDSGQEFGDGDFQIRFPSPQSLVQLWGGSECDNAPATLTAFSCVGTVCNIVAPIDSHVTTPGQVSVLFSVATSTPQINMVSFHVEIQALAGNCAEEIDDLHFEGGTPPTSGPPPTIQLSAPASGNGDYSTQSVVATGTYTGSSLYQLEVDLVTLETQAGTPSILPAVIIPQASGTNVPFSVVLKSAGQLPIGDFQVAAKITDFNNQTGQASINFSNFPAPLAATDPNFGAFRFGVNDTNCDIAFFQGGAIAKFPQGSIPLTTSIPTGIFQKWLTVNSPILWPNQTLGCPIAEAVFVKGNWQAQDFEHGRIFLPAQSPAIYVPGILRSAIQALTPSGGGNNTAIQIDDEFITVGQPVADPDLDLDVDNPTWAFQRFAQSDLDPFTGPPTWNTLEIRGRTPQLFVERVGGDPGEASQAEATNANSTPVPRVNSATPTIWQTFPCTKMPTDQSPTACDLSSLVPRTGPDMPFSPVAHLCGGDPGCESGQDDACSAHNCPTSGVTPPPKDWATTVNNDDLTTYEGIIRDQDIEGPDQGSHLANRDNPFDHTYCNPTVGRELDSAGDIGLGLVDCVGSILGLSSCDVVSKAKNIDYCRSDWNLHTRPLPTATDWGFLASANTLHGTAVNVPIVDFEIEFEADFAQDYFRNFQPQPGDLVTVHGRRIVDCGHCPYRSEVHPPDLAIVERSIVFNPVFSNTGDPQFRSTDAYLWANAFLPNADGVIAPVAAVVHAPPRTSATAVLYVRQHENGYFRQEDGVVATTQTTTNGVAVTFSGTGAPPIVETDRGEWIYPGSPSNQNVIWGSPPPNPPSWLVGPKFVDDWEISWTPFHP